MVVNRFSHLVFTELWSLDEEKAPETDSELLSLVKKIL